MISMNNREGPREWPSEAQGGPREGPGGPWEGTGKAQGPGREWGLLVFCGYELKTLFLNE